MTMAMLQSKVIKNIYSKNNEIIFLFNTKTTKVLGSKHALQTNPKHFLYIVFNLSDYFF